MRHLRHTFNDDPFDEVDDDPINDQFGTSFYFEDWEDENQEQGTTTSKAQAQHESLSPTPTISLAQAYNSQKQPIAKYFYDPNTKFPKGLVTPTAVFNFHRDFKSGKVKSIPSFYQEGLQISTEGLVPKDLFKGKTVSLKELYEFFLRRSTKKVGFMHKLWNALVLSDYHTGVQWVTPNTIEIDLAVFATLLGLMRASLLVFDQGLLKSHGFTINYIDDDRVLAKSEFFTQKEFSPGGGGYYPYTESRAEYGRKEWQRKIEAAKQASSSNLRALTKF